MARSQSPGDLQDFWKEFEDIESSKKENEGEEEETSKTPDEGELEAQWLQEAGYGFLVNKYQAGKELTDDEIQALTSSLPRNHAAVVKKRVDTLNATLRKKQKYTTKIDVRNIFPQQRTSEPVVIHSQLVDEPDDKPRQAIRPTTLPRGMKLSQSYGGENLWIRQMSKKSASPKKSSFEQLQTSLQSSNSEFRPNPTFTQAQSSVTQSTNERLTQSENECSLQSMFTGLQISRSDSQESDSLLTSHSRSKSSSCDTLDSIDSGLDSSYSNLNKDQSSSKDSIDCVSVSPKVTFPHPGKALSSLEMAGHVPCLDSEKVGNSSGVATDSNDACMGQKSGGNRQSSKTPSAHRETACCSPSEKELAASGIGQDRIDSGVLRNHGHDRKTQVGKPEGQEPSPRKSWPLNVRSRKRKHREMKAPKSPVSPRSEVIHPEFGNRQNRGSANKGAGPFNKNRGGYSMSGLTEEVQDNAEMGVEMLSLQQQRETYNKRNSQLSPISDSDITFEFSIEENGKDFGSSMPASMGDNMPNFSLVHDKLGLTRICDISDRDLMLVRNQSLLEVTHLFDNHNITYARRRSKKKYKEQGLFGVPLQVLLDQDQKLVPHTRVPIVFTELIKYLVKNCLDTEGILRIPGSSSRVKQLREELEDRLYQGTFIWGDDVTPNDVAALMKQFLRELPVPLLTDEYIEAFAQVENLPDRKQQLHALNLLILLLPSVHRDTLHALLEILELVIDHSSTNRMSLNNVSMIMAPNLFMAPKVRSSNPQKDNKRAWEVEIKMAAGTSNVMKMMIKYRNILWTIPTYLISLVRRQYELEQLRKNKENKTRMKFLAKKDKTEVYKKPNIKHENDFQEGVVRVQAPHLTKSSTAIQLDDHMTAGDIVSKFRVIQGSQTLDPRRMTQSMKSSQMQVFADPRNFMSAGDDTFLFEKGGNIGERCLPNDTNMLALYKVNPNAEWIIKRKGSS